MTPDAIRTEIETYSGEDWERDLLARFRSVDGAELFHGLFPLAVSSQTGAPAYPAAWLLYKLKPACPISCRDAIRALLSADWDVSIEEPVFYLAEQFGVSVVRTTVEQMRPEISDSLHQKHLDTISYWVGCFQEMLDYRAQNEAV